MQRLKSHAHTVFSLRNSMHHQFTDAKGVYQENSNGAIMHVQNPSPTKLVCKQSRQYLQYIGPAIFKAADQGTKALA